MMDRDRDWVALHLAGGVGTRKKRELLEKVGGPGEVFRMTETEIRRTIPCSCVCCGNSWRGLRPSCASRNWASCPKGARGARQ